MGLKKLAEKVVEYNKRFERGKAEKIKPGHVEKVLVKLRKKSNDLKADIASAENPDKKARLANKLDVANTHIERAEWLLKEID
jgi:hypothetical protein